VSFAVLAQPLGFFYSFSEGHAPVLPLFDARYPAAVKNALFPSHRSLPHESDEQDSSDMTACDKKWREWGSRQGLAALSL
jgi:hypothetical protein